jgi:putative addiction module component (TIGR02574 family)
MEAFTAQFISMNAACESIITAAMKLAPEDRSQLATWLWESAAVPMPAPSEAELETLLNQREAEMDGDPAQEISHETLMAHFANRR